MAHILLDSSNMRTFARGGTTLLLCAKHGLCGLVTAIVFMSRPVCAGSGGDHATSAKPTAPQSAPNLVVGPRFGLGGGLNLGGVVGRLDVGYRVTESLLAGGFIETPIASERLDDSACHDDNIECIDRYVLAGARLELDPFPAAVFAPWLGAELGALGLFGRNAKPVVPEIGADLGFEIRVFRELGVGPYVALAVALVDPYVTDSPPNQISYVGTPSLGSFGLRIAGRFDTKAETRENR